MQAIKIVDSTLRDGLQQPGVHLTYEQKLKIAMLLDKMRIYEIEMGFYDWNCEETDIYDTLMGEKKYSKVSLWSRLNKFDVEETCQRHPDIIHISIPVSEVQIATKLHTDKATLEKRLLECIAIANEYQVDITLGLEDASRAQLDYLIEIAQLAKDNRVKTIRLADTLGIYTPDQAKKVVETIKNIVDIPLEIHEHNDFGMAIANSVAMLHAGADYIDCTLSGIGERTGNCNLKEFVEVINNYYDSGIDLDILNELDEYIEEILESNQ